METAGIDLAAQPASTAACAVRWGGGAAEVTHLVPHAADDELLALARSADKVGIDAPFGWPDEFVDALVAHRGGDRWPGHGHADQDAFRASLSFRETDRFARGEGARPLSVATDRIALPAMRCALLLDRLAAAGEPVDRAGTGRVVEVYPAAALARWGLPPGGYKRRAGRARLASLVGKLLARTPWLELAPAARGLCTRSDDALDALLSALVARAAALGLTAGPPAEAAKRASREGWIHLPQPGSLERLV